MAGPPATRRPGGPRVRWGLPDVVGVWIGAALVSVVAVLPYVTADGIPRRDEPAANLVALYAQGAATVGLLAFVARVKGTGRLGVDFGLRVGRGAWAWAGAGLGLMLLSTALVAPLVHLADRRQEVVRVFERADGAQAALFVLGVVAVAPLAEELLFRGALLRGLMRRFRPPVAIGVQALAFGLVHLVGGIGSGPVLPALVLLGLVSGWRAVVTGGVGSSILLHAGFNLLSALVILA